MPERKRLLFVHPNSEVGGSDIALLRTVKALDQRRWEPLIALPKSGPMVHLFEEAGARVLVAPMQMLRTLPSLTYQCGYLWRFWPTVFQLRSLMKREKVDLVHTNSLYCLYGAWAAWLAGIPHLWHIREIPPQIPVARWLFGRMVLLLSRKVACTTHAIVSGLFGSCRSTRIEILIDGIDLSEWSETVTGERIRRELGIAPDDPVVGFVGRLDPWKGLDVFIRAAARAKDHFPRARFLISGGPPNGFEQHEQDMKKLANTLGLGDRILFTGWRYRLDEIKEVMASLDVFCHTSTSPEPFGLVLIEAMAMSRPVIGAKAGGPLEIVEDGVTGILTPPGDDAVLAEAIAKVLQDTERAREMGRAGRMRVEQKFSSTPFKNALQALYERILPT